jgi:uncharacterized cupin superfamily protein
MNPTTDPIAVHALAVEPSAKQTSYPEPYATMVAGRLKRRLGDVFGLKNFGVNLTRLAPGAISSLRHAHTKQDELIYVLEGTPTLITNAGHTFLQPGTCAGFRAGTGNAHHLRNETRSEVWYLEIGDRIPGDAATYPDDDIMATESEGSYIFTRKDRSPLS